HMEEELDDIENHKIKRNEVLTEFWEPFNQSLLIAESKMPAVKGSETGEICPQCGKPLVVRFSKIGKFLGCSGYPERRNRKRRAVDRGREAPVLPEHMRPNCGKPMLQRMGRRGPFLGCSGYPACKTTMNFDAEGKPVLASRPTAHACDKCGQPMVLRE